MERKSFPRRRKERREIQEGKLVESKLEKKKKKSTEIKTVNLKETSRNLLTKQGRLNNKSLLAKMKKKTPRVKQFSKAKLNNMIKEKEKGVNKESRWITKNV